MQISHLIKINDVNSSGLLSFDLIDLINLVRVEGAALKWSILGDLWIIERSKPTNKDMRKRILRKEFERPGGLTLSWDELVTYAENVLQTIDGIYAGFASLSLMPHYQDLNKGSELYESAEIVFEACDSSYWLVYARDEAIINRMQSAFQHTELISSY